MDGRAFLCLVVCIVASAALKQTPAGKSGWTGKLLVVPLDGSHWTGVKAVAEEMGRRGHTVIVLIPEISMRMGPGKHYMTKKFPVPYSQDLFNQMMAEHSHQMTDSSESLLVSVFSKVRHMKMIFYFIASTSESLFKDQELMEFLREQNFDAVLTDPALPMGAILAYNLSVPAVYMLRGLPCGLDAMATACPDPPSYVPRYFTRNMDRMTFVQRVGNMLVSMLELPLCKIIYGYFEEVASNFLQRDVSLMDILSSGALWLMRYDFSLEFPKPLMPNMVLIGGINCEIRNPLTKATCYVDINLLWNAFKKACGGALEVRLSPQHDEMEGKEWQVSHASRSEGKLGELVGGGLSRSDRSQTSSCSYIAVMFLSN